MGEFFNFIMNYLSGLSENLDKLFDQAGLIPYLILWLNMFLETGGVIFAFLPGNSVLLATAAFTATSNKVRMESLIVLFFSATMLGDLSSFMIGKFLGRKYKSQNRIHFINQEQFQSAHDYFAEHGRKTFILSRFIPVFRGLMPLAAGFTQVSYKRILPYSFIGVVLWNAAYLSLGYFFGNIPQIKNNFSLIIFIIILVTMIPTFIVLFRNMKKLKTSLKDTAAPGQSEQTKPAWPESTKDEAPAVSPPPNHPDENQAGPL